MGKVYGSSAIADLEQERWGGRGSAV